MNAVTLGEGRWELDALVKRVEMGETIDILRDGRVVAKVVPGEARKISEPEQPMTAEEWKAFLEDLRIFRNGLPYDPSNSVEEMRREARY